MRSTATAVLVGLLCVALPASGQERTGSIRGTVKDPTGAAVPGARVEATGEAGQKAATSNAQGEFAVERLPPGRYTVSALKQGFAPFAATEVEVSAGRATTLEVALAVASVQETVLVSETQSALSLSSANAADAIVMKGKDLDALPDDPDELAEALLALAGPSAGPNGGQIDVDGFSGGLIPPKSAIREIRISASPFSAEYDRPGHGHIEILTKPGSEDLRAEASFNFNNQALNTRDPFASNDPNYRRAVFGGRVSGPVPGRKASYTLFADRRAVDDMAIVSGTTLDGQLQPLDFQQAVVTPNWLTRVEPRLDLQLGARHTLAVEYEYESVERDKGGVGGFSLPSRAYDTTDREHELQVRATSVLGKLVSETRARWSLETRDVAPYAFGPSLDVRDAFASGGAPSGSSADRQKRYEVQEIVSRSGGSHAMRAGLRLRGVQRQESSRRDFNGTVTIAGGLSPILDAANKPVLGPDGRPQLQETSSLERYRRTLLLQKLGFSPDLVRALGGGATQLQIAGGDPLASISQWDLGVFLQDDWRPRPDLLVGLGLRYEAQGNVRSRLDLSPRVSLAWSPGGREKPRTVVRAGVGVFHDRIGESLSLDARRYDGRSLSSYLVTDPTVLDRLSFVDGGVTSLPSVEDLRAYALPQTVRVVDPEIETPRTVHWSLSFERALPGNLSLVASYLGTRTDHALRSRVLDPPLAASGAERVYQYESTGRFRQDQLILGLNSRVSSRVGLSLRYTLGWAKSDTDGAASFPSDPSDPHADWARAGIDQRHRLMLMGRLEGPWGIRVSPFVIVSSGRPFDITTGRDDNGDGIFNDRPAFAASASDPNVVQTSWGRFDVRPATGAPRIPRNYGQGPVFAVVNLRLSRTFALRSVAAAGPPDDPSRPPAAGGAEPGGPGHGPGHGGGPGMGGHGPGGHGPGASGGDGGPGLTLSLSIQNLLNRTNPTPPVGDLSSPRFGESLSSAGGYGYGGGGGAGNRRIELQLRLSF